MRVRLLFCALLLSLASETHAENALRAVRLDATNVASLSPGGADATGGVGDWALTNGVLCAVVADPAHESDLSTRGGGLIDLGHCGRGDDQLVLLQPLVNLDRSGAVLVDRVRAETAEGVARVVATGRVAGCEVETRFELDADVPDRLRVTSRVVRRDAGPRVFAFGDVVLHLDHAVRPFGLDSAARFEATGFQHPPLDLASALSIARATHPGDTRILAGAHALEPGIAYALRWTRAESDGAPLPIFSLSAESFSAVAAFAAPFWFGAKALGPLQLVQSRWMDVARGETLVFEREIRVAPRADVASLTDRLFETAPRVAARVADPGARIVVRREDGRVATEAAVVDGRVAFRLPRGRYELRVLGVAGGETQRAFEVAHADLDLGELEAPPFGTVALPEGHAMRLAFVGLGGTPDPRFGDERPPVRFGPDTQKPSSRTRDVSLAGIASDPRSVPLAPGRYRVRAGRGPEYGVTETEIEVRAGETTHVEIEPPARVLETPGWIGVDLHVHAAPSDDSALPLDVRLATFVAEGAEVLVATDHDMVTDYAPRIRALGLEAAVASVAGQELTSNVASEAVPFTFGHANVFPLPYQATAYRRGALPSEGRRLRQAIDSVRALGGERIVQLNHARSGGDFSGFFDHLSVGHAFAPEAPLAIPPNGVLVARDPVTGTRDLDFDAMELLNGGSMERYRALREDWFSLLRQGEFRTGTASSDTHVLDEVAATPRSLVRVEGDTPARFEVGELVAAIRAGRLVGTTGPILDARVGEAGLGETHRGREAEIVATVRAAPWVPVSQVRAYVNGVLAHEGAPGADGTVRFPHAFERDAFVTLEVEGRAEPGSAYAERLPGMTPFAFTNPIFVDADEDGAWTAPEAEAPRIRRSEPKASGQ